MNGTLRPESFRGAKPAEDNISIPLARLLEPPRQIDAITNRGGRIFVSRAGVYITDDATRICCRGLIDQPIEWGAG
jgi:hypothetical protein